MNFADIYGRSRAKRALEIAVAGGHNILFVGAPGQGKSLLAQAIPSIAPPMERNEILEVSSLWQSAGEAEGLVIERPVRSVDASATKTAMIGGGSEKPYPGEVTLAHRGVLFADEVLEFNKSTVQALRGPLQDGVVNISRTAWKIQWPAQFQFVAACNPCPCGYLGDPSHECTCSGRQKRTYAAKLSGPLVERIPIRLELDSIQPEDIPRLEAEHQESSDCVRDRIIVARERQTKRYQHEIFSTNAELSASSICMANDDTRAAAKVAREHGLSPRGYHNLRKVARSIADIEGHERVDMEHFEEAATYLRLPTLEAAKRGKESAE